MSSDGLKGLGLARSFDDGARVEGLGPRSFGDGAGGGRATVEWIVGGMQKASSLQQAPGKGQR